MISKPPNAIGNPKGQLFEAIAIRYLTKQGLLLIEQNFTSRFGELDLIMQSANELIFIEVKFRSYTDFGSGLESITYRKQKKIIMAAKHFLNRHQQFQQRPTRFDVIAIQPKHSLSAQPHLQALEAFKFDWIINAFDIGDCFSCL